MDKLSVKQKSPKEKAAAHRSGKKGKKSKGAQSDDEQQRKPQMKVVYISNPMRVTTTPSEFKDRVQELTGRHADVADIFFNSSSEQNGCNGAGAAASSAPTTSEYYSPCSSSSHDDDTAPPASAGWEPANPPQTVHHQAELMGHQHLDMWRGGGGHIDQEDAAPLFRPFTDGSSDNYYPNTFESHLLANQPLPPASTALQSPPARPFESPLADAFRRLADGRP